MEIKLVPVKQEEKNILLNLYQLYYYDFSEFTNQDINKEGKFDVNIDFFWEGDHRWHPYFIETSGRIAGFVIVLLENLDVDPDPTHVIYDFMVMKKYRRKGIGHAAAIQAFKLYKANWKIVQMATNTPAISFWRKVIKDYTKSKYTEIFRDDVKKYVQSFSTKP
ncbi:GNAT family N-acetyltransferase [Paenibacillus sp. 7124]|uniref:GNAT family N-acetyltransferase n=2 Tax=Paenibacillus TaxID=44249 RepID=A0A6M1PMS6_9BACL|nr:MULTISPECIES: GNAT family N-acetyltransferase [Paenibacillus]AHV98793.1 GCN5-like N-acetyltransferase [Paenibacillus sabinae T27]NGM83778.1 GNAT family N-acetyltransferase [Paenibacillus apii]NJJ41119.1 GNAT family N-acetyltransferase [Paenibacillus apii]